LKQNNKNNLKRRSLKEAMLAEQVTEPIPQSSADFTPPNSKPVSLDQIVDRYIVRYERESIPLEGQGLPQPIDERIESDYQQVRNTHRPMRRPYTPHQVNDYNY
jgi:hypothetical protein